MVPGHFVTPPPWSQDTGEAFLLLVSRGTGGVAPHMLMGS